MTATPNPTGFVIEPEKRKHMERIIVKMWAIISFGLGGLCCAGFYYTLPKIQGNTLLVLAYLAFLIVSVASFADTIYNNKIRFDRKIQVFLNHYQTKIFEEKKIEYTAVIEKDQIMCK